MSWRSVVAGELDEFAEFCAELTLDTGGPMLLEPFQRAVLADYFEGVTETLILLPKKQGKTTLLAALALYHLLVSDEAECVVAATSRDQATILYDQALGLIRRSPTLQPHVSVKRGYREIRGAHDVGRVRVLAADVDTADGVLPTLGLVDELGRAKSAELYGVFRDGLGPRGGRMVTISTAGERESGPFGQLRQAARQLPGLVREGKHSYVRAADGSFALHEWALEPEDDVDDLAVVKEANPASWQTLELLARRHDSPSMLPWQWARFACGIWTSGEAWWIDAERWQRAASAERLQPGEQITIGFDGSRGGVGADATALIACRLSDGLLQPLGIWEAPSPELEWEVPEGEVDATLARALEEFQVVRGYFDPPLWQTQIDQWAREYGDPAVMRFSTARSRMMSATERFRTDLISGQLKHVGDPTLTRHVLNAQMREVRGGYWLAKQKPSSAEKIDAAVASTLAYEARADALSAGAGKPERSRRLLTF
jgi:phage terminase large subunit-like protein